MDGMMLGRKVVKSKRTLSLPHSRNHIFPFASMDFCMLKMVSPVMAAGAPMAADGDDDREREIAARH